MTINNDSDFKAALSKLLDSRDSVRSRARFAESVLTLSKDVRVKNAIEAAKRTDISDDELDAAYKSAKKASVDSFTQCGKECDWNSQAGHFVAQAALACLEPGGNPAWECRDACAHGTHQREHRHRYRHRQCRDHRAIPHSG